MWKPDHSSGTAKSIRIMLEKGWFDGAIGRIEGSAIFRGLMTSGIFSCIRTSLNVVLMM